MNSKLLGIGEQGSPRAVVQTAQVVKSAYGILAFIGWGTEHKRKKAMG